MPKRVRSAGEHREEARERHHEHVAVRDVRELVREHALDLARLEAAPEAGRDRDGRVLRAPAGRERVRDVGVDDRDPRLRQVGERAEPLDHVVELRRLVALDDLRARRGSASLSEVKYWNSAMPTTITIIGISPTLSTWNSTTANTTYSRPSSPLVKSIRGERPASRPKAFVSSSPQLSDGTIAVYRRPLVTPRAPSRSAASSATRPPTATSFGESFTSSETTIAASDGERQRAARADGERARCATSAAPTRIAIPAPSVDALPRELDALPEVARDLVRAAARGSGRRACSGRRARPRRRGGRAAAPPAAATATVRRLSPASPTPRTANAAASTIAPPPSAPNRLPATATSATPRRRRSPPSRSGGRGARPPRARQEQERLEHVREPVEARVLRRAERESATHRRVEAHRDEVGGDHGRERDPGRGRAEPRCERERRERPEREQHDDEPGLRDARDPEHEVRRGGRPKASSAARGRSSAIAAISAAMIAVAIGRDFPLSRMRWSSSCSSATGSAEGTTRSRPVATSAIETSPSMRVESEVRRPRRPRGG